MTYKILTEVGHSHSGLGGGHREDDPLLGGLAAQLKVAMFLLKESTAAPVAAGGVGANKNRFEQLARQQKADTYQAEVIQAQARIRMRGARWDADGNVTWPPGTAFVQYDYTLESQGLTQALIEGGRLYHKVVGGKEPVNTTGWATDAHEPGAALYVMSAQGNFHYGAGDWGRRHHSSLLAGTRVAGAGEFMTDPQGRITYLSNDSGHYEPNLKHFLQVLHQLQKPKNQVVLDAVRIVYIKANYNALGVFAGLETKPYTGLRQFMTGERLDDDSYEANNLAEAYGHLLMSPGGAAILAGKGWQYSVIGGGVISQDTGRPVPLHDVRLAFRGMGTPAVATGAGR